MRHVQLVEKVSGVGGLWLDFWDLKDERLVSIELNGSGDDYRIGDVFDLDDSQPGERLTLRLIDEPGVLERLRLLIDRPSNDSGQSAGPHVLFRIPTLRLSKLRLSQLRRNRNVLEEAKPAQPVVAKPAIDEGETYTNFVR